MNICIFGDSITYGSFDSEKGDWANRLNLEIKKSKKRHKVYNLGVSGNIAQDVLDRFGTEALSRKPDKIIFAIGINDAQFLIKEKRNQTSIDKFGKNINELILKAKKYTKDIIFISLTPVDKKKTSPIPWHTNRIYNNIYIERYNSKLKEICQREKIKFIDLYSKLIKMDYKKLLEDGLHPNSEGHEWMAEKIIKELKL